MKVGQLTIDPNQEWLFEQSCLEFYTRYNCAEAVNAAGRAILGRRLKRDYGTDTFLRSLSDLCQWFDRKEAQVREQICNGAVKA
ncbi:MAG: hypothetical protein Kow0063_27930 [Anaerolineae bacterium]